MENIENLMSIDKINKLNPISPASKNLIQLLNQPEPLESFNAMLSFNQVKQITNFIKEFSSSINKLEESSNALSKFLSENHSPSIVKDSSNSDDDIAVNSNTESEGLKEIDSQRDFLAKPTLRQEAKENKNTYSFLVSDFIDSYNEFSNLLEENSSISQLTSFKESIYSLEDIYEETLSDFNIENDNDNNKLILNDKNSSLNEISSSDFNRFLTQLNQTLSLIEDKTSEFALSLANVNFMETTIYSPKLPPTYLNDLLGVGLYIDIYL